MKIVNFLLTSGLAAGLILRQAKPARLEFEVVSIKPAEGLIAGKAAALAMRVDGAQVEVRRVETLRTTQNCNCARSTPADDLKARESKVVFNIEYIAVKDTPEALGRFQTLMCLYECFGDNSLIRDFNRGAGVLFGGVDLETVKVNYSQTGMPSWNQIHCFGGVPGIDPAARKAAHEAARNALTPAGVASASDAEHAATTIPRRD